jgi:hypothetical protein
LELTFRVRFLTERAGVLSGAAARPGAASKSAAASIEPALKPVGKMGVVTTPRLL